MRLTVGHIHAMQTLSSPYQDTFKHEDKQSPCNSQLSTQLSTRTTTCKDMKEEKNSQDQEEMDGGAVGEPEWAFGRTEMELGRSRMEIGRTLESVFILCLFLQGFHWVLLVLLCFVSWLLFVKKMVESSDDQVGRSPPSFFCKSMEHMMGRGT